MSRDDPARHLVLVGMMGSGKSTVGPLCAAALDRPFVDTDAVVVELAGASIPELFARGEESFRRHERAAVAIVVESPEPLVIACGGGAVLDAENRAALGRGVVVWLRADAAVLAERVGGAADRPLLTGEVSKVEALDRLIRTREPVYTAASDAVVDACGTPEDVARRVLAAYEELR